MSNTVGEVMRWEMLLITMLVTCWFGGAMFMAMLLGDWVFHNFL